MKLKKILSFLVFLGANLCFNTETFSMPGSRNIKAIRCFSSLDGSGGGAVHVDMDNGEFYYYDQRSNALINARHVNKPASYLKSFFNSSKDLYTYESYFNGVKGSIIQVNMSTLTGTINKPGLVLGQWEETPVNCQLEHPPAATIYK